LAYITSSYTHINISYILSQHIDSINIININIKCTCKTHLDLQKHVYSYIYVGPSGHPNVYIQKKYIGPQARATSWYKTRLTSLITTVYTNTKYIRVPLTHPLLPLPPEEVVALPYLLQPVVVEHLQDPPALEADVHSSSQPPQLLAVIGPAMVPATLHTAPGNPHPGCGSTCPQAHPAALSQNGGICPLSLLRLPPVEHVIPHPGHQSGASALVSGPCW
jgi:hypothetical protein